MSSLAWREMQAKLHAYEARLVAMDSELMQDADKAETRRLREALARVAEMCRSETQDRSTEFRIRALAVIGVALGAESTKRDPTLCGSAPYHSVDERVCVLAKGHEGNCRDGRQQWKSNDARRMRRSMAGTRAFETRVAAERDGVGR